FQLLSYFCMLTHPPRISTLSTSTTLFRSSRRRRTPVGVHRRAAARDQRCPGLPHGPRQAFDEPGAGPGGSASPSHLARGARCRRDRKSTRLHSSHVKSSYAVFCLKKKT